MSTPLSAPSMQLFQELRPNLLLISRLIQSMHLQNSIYMFENILENVRQQLLDFSGNEPSQVDDDLSEHQRHLPNPIREEIAKFVEYPFIFLFDRDHNRRDVPLRVLEQVVSTWIIVMRYREPVKQTDDDWMRYLVLMRNIYKVEKYFGSAATASMMRDGEPKDPTDPPTTKRAESTTSDSLVHNTASTEEIQLLLLELFSEFLRRHTQLGQWSDNMKVLSILPEIITRVMEIGENNAVARRVRVKALQQLQLLLLRINKKERIELIMPGILSCMLRIVQKSDFKVGHSVFQEVYRVFEIVLTAACHDSPNSAESTPHLSFGDLLKMDKSLSQSQTPHLQANTLSELEKRIDLAFAADQYQSMHSLAKQAMVRCAKSVFLQCYQNLKRVACTLLEVVIMASYDESQDSTDELRAFSRRTLSEIQHSLGEEFLSDAMFSYFEDRFSVVVRRLSRIPTLVSESEKRALFSLLNSYLMVFGEKLRPCIQSQFSDICLSLLVCAKFLDTQKIQEISFQSNINLKSTVHEGAYMRPNFQFLHDESTIASVQLFAQLLGKCCDSRFAIAQFRSQIYEKHSEYQEQSVYILNHLLRGTAQQLSSRVMLPIATELLDSIVSDNLWPQLSTTDATAPAIHQMHHYVMMSCLLLETIGTLASILKSSFSEVLLIKCLFRVLEKLGDQHGLVQDAALKTLDLLAESLNCSNVAELVSQNADYIVDDICYRMQDLNLYPDTPKILGVLLQHTELYSKAHTDAEHVDGGYESMIGLIRDTLSSIFEGLDNHLHASQSNAHILVTFFSMLRSISRLLVTRRQKRDAANANRAAEAKEDAENDESDEELPPTRTVDDIDAYFRRIHSKKHELLDTSPVEPKSDNPESDSSLPGATKFPPLKSSDEEDTKGEVSLIKDILLRCQHFAQVNDLRVQHQVMDLFLESCEYFIHDNSLDSDLLPLIHALWPSILRYIVEDISPVIQERCLDVIARLVPRANLGEFLYGRIIDDVWPSLFQKMNQRLSPEEYLKRFEERIHVVAKKILPAQELNDEILQQVFEGEIARLEYKVRRRALRFLAAILSTPVFRQRIAAVPSPQNTKAALSHRTIIQVTLPYLDARQPTELQHCAMDVMSTLISISPDPLWFFLCEILAEQQQVKMETEGCVPVEIRPYAERFGFRADSRYLCGNAQALLQKIEDAGATTH